MEKQSTSQQPPATHAQCAAYTHALYCMDVPTDCTEEGSLSKLHDKQKKMQRCIKPHITSFLPARTSKLNLKRNNSGLHSTLYNKNSKTTICTRTRVHCTNDLRASLHVVSVSSPCMLQPRPVGRPEVLLGGLSPEPRPLEKRRRWSDWQSAGHPVVAVALTGGSRQWLRWPSCDRRGRSRSTDP